MILVLYFKIKTIQGNYPLYHYSYMPGLKMFTNTKQFFWIENVIHIMSLYLFYEQDIYI